MLKRDIYKIKNFGEIAMQELESTLAALEYTAKNQREKKISTGYKNNTEYYSNNFIDAATTRETFLLNNLFPNSNERFIDAINLPQISFFLIYFMRGGCMKRITEIAMFAAELMGARNASIWLDTPNEGLDGKKPSEIWNDPTGAAKVETLLFKIKRRREL